MNEDEYKLVVPFPSQDPLFARAVAWEMFRQRLMNEDDAFVIWLLKK